MQKAIPSEFHDALPDEFDLEDCEITTYGELCEEHSVNADAYPAAAIPSEALVVIEPGWRADDGNQEIRYPDIKSGQKAALEYVAGGDWGRPDNKTFWIDVAAWREAHVWLKDADGSGESIRLQVDDESRLIAVEPEEPDCGGPGGHDWQSPHEIVGGIEDNPGVWGHGGGVFITEVCAHCGAYRITDTWAQDRATGTQGLVSVEYEEANDESLGWVEARTRQRILALIDDHGAEAVQAAICDLMRGESSQVGEDGEVTLGDCWVLGDDLKELAGDLEARFEQCEEVSA